MMNETLTEQLAVADVIVPASASANTYVSLGVDMSKFKRVRYDVLVGAVTGAGTLDGNLQSCALSNFASGVHNITNSNLAQVTNAAPNTVSTMEVRADQVEQQNHGDRYVRARIVTAVNTVLFGVIGHGGEAAQKPAKNFGLNSTYVNQQVVTNT